MKNNNESKKIHRSSLFVSRHPTQNNHNNKGTSNLYDNIKNNNNRRTLIQRKETSDERMNQVGDYHEYHSLLPKRNTVLPANIDVHSAFQEKWTHRYDFQKFNPFEKKLWNLILQVHPSIKDGNADGYLSYYFDRLIVVAHHKHLREWKKAGVKAAIKACKIRLQYEEDSDDDSDSFWGNEYEIVGNSANYEREIKCIKEFLLCLSINPIFDSHFITDDTNEIRVYCPCHKIMSNWNKLSGVNELIDEKDTCNKNSCPFKTVSGFKTHIASCTRSSIIHFAMDKYITEVYSKKNVHLIRRDIKNTINHQDRAGYSIKKNKNEPKAQLLFTNKNTGISAEIIEPPESSTSGKIRRGGHNIQKDLRKSGEYNSCQQQRSVVTNSSRNKLNASGGDSHKNNSRCTSRGDYGNNNGNKFRGWGGDDNSRNSNISEAWGGDSNTNISKLKTQGKSKHSSSGWENFYDNDVIEKLMEEKNSLVKCHHKELEQMQEKYEILCKNLTIKKDEDSKKIDNSKALLKKKEDECCGIRTEKNHLQTKLNDVIKENNSMKKTIANVKDNMTLINEKENEVSGLKSQIDKMRREAIISEKIRKEQDTDTTLTDYYNDALNEYLLHVESINCRLRNQVINLQRERRTVEKALVSTQQRCNYYERRLKTLETDNRNLLLTATLGNRTLDYKSRVLILIIQHLTTTKKEFMMGVTREEV